MERLKLLYLSLALAIMGGSQFRLGDLEGGDLLLFFVLGLVLSFNLLERLNDPLERSFLLSGLLIDRFYSFLPRLFFYVCSMLPACFDKRDFGLPFIEVSNIESRASEAFLTLSFLPFLIFSAGNSVVLFTDYLRSGLRSAVEMLTLANLFSRKLGFLPF